MNVVLTQPIANIDGTVLKEGFTIGDAILQCLLTPTPGDEALTGQSKVEFFKLAVKINSANESVNLSVEEIVCIKERSGRLFAPLVVGRLWEALDPASS